MKIEDESAIPSTKSRKPTRDAEGSILKRIEERRTSNGKTKQVTVYYARVRYTDKEGKQREKKRRVDSYNDAVIKRRELQDEIQKELAEAEIEIVEKPKTFNEILDIFENDFVKQAVIKNGQKTDGYKENLENIKYQIKLFRESFGTKLITEITYDDIRDYKNNRLAVPVEIVSYKRVPISDEERASMNVNIRQKFRREKQTRIKQREFAPAFPRRKS